YVGHGIGTLRSLGSLSSSGHRDGSGLVNIGTMLLSGDASYDVSAVGNVRLEGEGQVSAFGPSPLRPNDDFVYFLRYGPSSALRVQSSGGNVDFYAGQNVGRVQKFGDYREDPSVHDLYPATVQFAAFGGDLNLHSSRVTSVASPTGGLTLFAARDIVG